jgi:putative endonuclease
LPAATASQINTAPDPALPTTPAQHWFVYLVQTGKGLLYTGISTNPARRLRQHQGTLAGGAKALRGKGPLTLVWQYQAPNRQVASRLEYQLKQLKKADKERLIAGALLTELLPQPE